MSIIFSQRIELKTVPSAFAFGQEYEVWFTDERQEKWHVSKPVAFARALELLVFVNDMYANKNEAVMLPEEFHIIGRLEPK